MGKLNEIQEQTTQSYGSNSFTTRIKENTVEFDSAKDKFTFLDPVEVPSLNIGGTSSVVFTQEEKTKLSQITTPMQIKGRVDSVSDLPTEDVSVGDTYLIGLSGSETFDEYVCVGFAGTPEAPVWESVGTTQAQADWNQNNATAPDYIKNRICYESETEVIYLENANMNSYGNIDYLFNPPQDMLSGTYTVSIGEETVTLTMTGDSSSTSGTFYLSQGNGNVYWNANGMSDAPNGEKAMISGGGNPALYANAAVKIYTTSTELVTIDDRFIPDTVARVADIPAQVQADWNQNDSTAVDYIKNKPTIPSAQVQSDWNQNDSSAADYIKNRICYDGRESLVYAQATIDENGYINGGVYDITQPFAAETYTIIIGDYEETTSVTLEQDGQTLGGGFTLAQGSGTVVYTIGENTVVIGVTSNPALYANKTLRVAKISGEIVTIDAKYLGFFVQQGTGSNSIIENNQINVASGTFSHSEGSGTTASGEVSHSEGSYNTASGNYSHSEGNWTTASGESSHSEGNETSASGYYSHSEGNHTIANHKSQHTFGEYNVQDPSAAAAYERGNYVEIVGNGISASSRSNARTLDWSGNEVLSGTLTANAGVSTKKLTISSIDPTDVFMHSEIMDASSDVAFSRVIANTSSSKTDGYVEILYKASSGVTCSAYIDSADVTLTADGAWHKLEQGCDPADGVEIHINNPSPVTDATLEVISKVYYI